MRAQCRTASKEKDANKERQPDRNEGAKSPKKTLFENIKHAFHRMPNNPPPLMPSKAAQIFGTASRDPHKIEVRPIKPSAPFATTTTLARSDTSKSLPEKREGRHVDVPAQSRSMSRRRPTEDHSLDQGNNYAVPAGDAPTVPEFDFSFKPTSPPPPPAKDTPPTRKHATNPSSPLRRARPSERLREAFDAQVDRGMKLHLPEFALSPSPLKTARYGWVETTPKQPQAYTTEDYARVLKGEPLQWSYPAPEGSALRQSTYRTPLTAEKLGSLRFLPPVRGNEKLQHSSYDSHQLRAPLLDLSSDLHRSMPPFADSTPQPEKVSAYLVVAPASRHHGLRTHAHGAYLCA